MRFTSRKTGLDVHLDHLVEHVVGHLQCGALTDVRRAVVDQDVDGPELCFGLADDMFQLVLAPDMAGNWQHLPRQFRQLPGSGFEDFQFAARDDDAGTGFDKPAGDGLADAASAHR